MDAVVVEQECTPAQQVEIDSTRAPNLAPRVQVMPTQEA
jgi:hypothetical protein